MTAKRQLSVGGQREGVNFLLSKWLCCFPILQCVLPKFCTVLSVVASKGAIYNRGPTESREEEQIQHECAANSAGKQEGGEQHTQRACHLTFDSRCHDAMNSVQTKICCPEV